MPSNRITITLLAISLVLNVGLAISMTIDSVNRRREVETAMIEMTEQSFRLQSEILADLESKDAHRVDALKARLRAGIAIQGGKSYLIRSSPKAHRAADSK